MVTEIVRTREATIGEWARAYAECEWATYFHGPEWSQIWEAYTRGRYRPTPRLVEFSDGVHVVLGLTTENVGSGIRRYHLSPAGTYGGWVGHEPLSPGHVEALAKEIVRLRSLVWRLSPYEQHDQVPPGAQRDVTHVIDLRSGIDEARAKWKGSSRREVGRAERAGTQFRLANSADDWLAYDALYRASIDRWGTASSAYDHSLFTLLHELDSPSVRLFVAETNGILAAGAIVFMAHRHAAYWHGASLGRKAPGAANLLQWHLLRVLESHGIETYDLNPSGGHAGVVSFKESLGAEPLPAPIVVEPHRLEGIARRVERWKERLRRREPS